SRPSESPPEALWVTHDGHLVHRGAGAADLLYLRYPLAGEFQISYDTLRSPESHIGLAYGQSYPNGRLDVLENKTGRNHVTLDVSPKSVRIAVNGHPPYDDGSPSQPSPWLAIHAHSEWPVLKNFRLRGAPTIPAEVRLVERDRLDGWYGAYYGDRL